nr:Transposon Ty3-G Gag-Pol polyprotein [Ipomoea batatas]
MEEKIRNNGSSISKNTSTFHQTPETQRLQIAGFCLEGDDSEWFRWMKWNRMIFGWHDFLEKVAQRFVSYVLGGLKPHVRRELLLAHPRTVLAAFELAKAHEARYNELMSECRTAYRGSPRFPSTNEDTQWQSKGTNFSQVTMRTVPTSQPVTTTLGGTGVPKFLPAPVARPTSGLPIRKYTSAEIRERRDKGLCFHCDQKYSAGHRCKGRFLLLIGDDDDEAIEGEPTASTDEVFDEEVISGDVSMLNTMSGPGSSRSLRLVGKIKSSPCVRGDLHARFYFHSGLTGIRDSRARCCVGSPVAPKLGECDS